MSAPHALQWFELPVVDFERARRFYSAVFAYDMPEMTIGANRMGILPHDPGTGIGGAIVDSEEMAPSALGTRVYLSAGDDLQGMLDRVALAGGEVITPKTQISPEHDFFAVFLDPEGNNVGLYSNA